MKITIELIDETPKQLPAHQHGIHPAFENPLARPVMPALAECLKALKFGRPAKDQDFLDKVIAQLINEPVMTEKEGSKDCKAPWLVTENENQIFITLNKAKK